MKSLYAAAAAAFLLAGPAAALAQSTGADPSGAWTTTMGDATLKATPKEGAPGVMEVTGKYNFNKGTLKGELKNGVFTGYWTEPGGGPACKTARDGVQEWGKVTFTFSGAESFKGRWQYCDAAPDQTWDGQKAG